MGAVFKAQHEHLDKTVAIKVLSAAVTHQADAVARFRREMRAVGKLNHPNIVQAHDAGEIAGTHYLAMEFIDGTDLLHLVRERGPMSVMNACKAVRQAAQALAAAHAAGLVHRDIKPSNLLVAKNGQMKVLDLGLALLAGEATTHTADLTTAGQAFGTPDYMAPEQWEDAHSADARTDLYALGCTLYFLLTGKAPYETSTHRTAINKMKGHLMDPPPDLQAARSDVPHDLVAIYQKLLAKKPADRYQTAKELAEVLAPFSSSKASHSSSTDAMAPQATMPWVFPPLAVEHGGSAPPPIRKISSAGRGWTPRQQGIAAGGAAALLLLGVIIITITNKDGTKTKLEFSGDAQQVEVAKDDKSLVKITPGEAAQSAAVPSNTAPTKPKPAGVDHPVFAADGKTIGWPIDAPKPAIAPFDAAQAKQHQKEWAAYLKVPVEYTNSIGMKFRLIPPGEFLMGSTTREIEEALKEVGDNRYWQDCIQSGAPQHKVILTQPRYLAENEVTQAEYEKMMGTSPSHFSSTGMGKETVAGIETTTHPVEEVRWEDAVEFCIKLNHQEGFKSFSTEAGQTTIPADSSGYRLPSEAEWEFACRGGTVGKYWFGDRDGDFGNAGWYGDNAAGRTRPVGQLQANPFGLFDVHGNVWEWVLDGWEPTYGDREPEKLVINPGRSLSPGPRKVIRGGSWHGSASYSRSSSRNAAFPGNRDFGTGFRVSLSVDAVKAALRNRMPKVANGASSWHGWPTDAPQPAIAPFDATQAKKHQEEWAAYLNVPVEYTNNLGMTFRLIPPGEFLMGSTPDEMETNLRDVGPDDFHWRECIQSEAPQHQVILTQPFYLAVHEVTQADFQSLMDKNPSIFSATGQRKANVDGLDTARHPVDGVSWQEAGEFCAKLSEKEKIVPAERTGYRLPTEAEWEFACRAGMTKTYWSGKSVPDLMTAGYFIQNSMFRTHPIGERLANPFGLKDTHGNVWEWVTDAWDAKFFEQFTEQPAINPRSPASSGSYRVLRGGDCYTPFMGCRAAFRFSIDPQGADKVVGLRPALDVQAVQRALKSSVK